jgi:CBS domain-containing protein
VIKLPMTATVTEALKLMLSCKITGVPVIDGSDRIIANVSVTDVRYLAKVKDDDVDRVLALPIMDFLIEVKTKLAGSVVAPPSLTPIVLHPGDSFATAIDLLTASGLHRLYIVDEANSPIGVFTLTDAIKTLSACM